MMKKINGKKTITTSLPDNIFSGIFTWERARQRKFRECCLCHRIVGHTAYRAIGTGKVTKLRICLSCAEKIKP